MKYRRALFASALLVACKGDAACIVYPCPVPLAATVTVTAANAAGPVAGAQLTVNGQVQGTGCQTAPATTCFVFGGTGRYDLEITAPGYATSRLTLTVTGTDAGCNTCGKIDQQSITLTLQPAPSSDRG